MPAFGKLHGRSPYGLEFRHRAPHAINVGACGLWNGSCRRPPTEVKTRPPPGWAALGSGNGLVRRRNEDGTAAGMDRVGAKGVAHMDWDGA